MIKLLLGVIVGAWVARYLGPSQLGKYNYVLAYISIIGTISTLGMESFLVKEILNNPEQKNQVLGTAFWMRVVTLIISFIILGSVFYRINPGTDYYYLFILLFSSLALIPFDLIDIEFQSQLLSRLTVVSKNVAFLLGSALKVFFLVSSKSLLWFAAVGGTEAFIAIFILIYQYQKRDNIFSWQFSAIRARQLLMTAWPFIVSGITVVLYMRLDQIMLGKVLGEKEVGQFSAAIRISEVVLFLPMAIASSYMPSLINSRKESKEIFLENLQKFFNWMFIISIALALTIAICSKQIVLLLYGDQYEDSIKILAIHVWAIVPIFMGVASSQYLVIENLQKYSFYRTAAGLVVNVVLNIFLIPTLGGIGAAISTLVAQLVAAFVVNYIFVDTRALFFMQIHSVLSVKEGFKTVKNRLYDIKTSENSIDN